MRELYIIGEVIIDKDDELAITQACVGLAQNQHVELLIKVVTDMYIGQRGRMDIMRQAAKTGNSYMVDRLLDLPDNNELNSTVIEAAYYQPSYG